MLYTQFFPYRVFSSFRYCYVSPSGMKKKFLKLKCGRGHKMTMHVAHIALCNLISSVPLVSNYHLRIYILIYII